MRTKGLRIRCRGTELNRVYISRQKTTLFKGSFVMCSFAAIIMLDRVLLDRVLLDRVLFFWYDFVLHRRLNFLNAPKILTYAPRRAEGAAPIRLRAGHL